MDKETINFVREQLNETGGANLVGPDGRRLFLVLNRNIGMDKNGLLIAHDSGAAWFFDLSRPLTPFVLVRHGFSISIAPALSSLVNALFSTSVNTHEEPLKISHL